MNFQVGNVGNEILGSGAKRRPLSAYQKFVKREFKVLQKEYPSKKAPEIMKMCAKKWRESKK